MPPAVAGAVTAGAAVVGTAGQLLGKGGSSQRGRSDELMGESYQAVKDVQLPSIESLQITPEEITFYEQTGQLTPRLEQAIAQDPSLLQKIKTDPELVKAQMAALTKLQQVGQEGGLTVSDRAKIFEAQGAMDRKSASDQAAILQRFQEMGRGGSTGALLAQLHAQQAGAEQGAQAGFDVASEANKRALDAIMQGGELAGSIRTQQFGEEEAKAKAQDLINQLNTNNRRDVQMRNIGAQNLAATSNLAEQQRIAEANAALKNQVMQSNKNVILSDYERRAQQARDLSAAAGGYASNLSARAKEEDLAAANKGAAVGQIGQSISDLYRAVNSGSQPAASEFTAASNSSIYDPNKYRL